MKYCRFHPDREAIPKSRLCRECYLERYRQTRRNYTHRVSTKTRALRDELNMKDLVNDAKKGWDLKNLCRRYKSYSYEMVCKILTDNNIPIKGEKSHREMNRDGVNGYSAPDMLDWTCSIKPTHQKARMSQ